MYRSSIIIVIKLKGVKRVVYVACTAGMRTACALLVWKPDAKKQIGRPRCRWERNIEMVKEIENVLVSSILGRIHLWDFVSTVMSLRVL
jgi:hypothetical protein